MISNFIVNCILVILCILGFMAGYKLIMMYFGIGI